MKFFKIQHIRDFREIFDSFNGNADAYFLHNYILHNIQWKNGTVNWKTGLGHMTVNLEKGQIIVGERQLANKFGWTRHRVRKALNHLPDHLLVEKFNHLYTRVTVQNMSYFVGYMPKLNHLKSEKHNHLPDRNQEENISIYDPFAEFDNESED